MIGYGSIVSHQIESPDSEPWHCNYKCLEVDLRDASPHVNRLITFDTRQRNRRLRSICIECCCVLRMICPLLSFTCSQKLYHNGEHAKKKRY